MSFLTLEDGTSRLLLWPDFDASALLLDEPRVDALSAAIAATNPYVHVPFNDIGNQVDNVSGLTLTPVGAAAVQTGHGPPGSPTASRLDGVDDAWLAEAALVTRLKTMLTTTAGVTTSVIFWRTTFNNTTQKFLYRLWQYGFGIYLASNQILAMIYDTTSTLRGVGITLQGSVYLGGGWQMGGLRFDRTTLECIYNGRPANKLTIAAAGIKTDSSTTAFAVGRDGGSATGHVSGAVAHLAIWDRLVDDDELYELYRIAIGGQAQQRPSRLRAVPARARTDATLLQTADAGDLINPDIDLVTSVGLSDPGSIPLSGELVIVDGALVYVDPHHTTPTVRFVGRTGDAFTIPAAADASGTLGPTSGEGQGPAVVGTKVVIGGYRSGGPDQRLLHFDIDGGTPAATPGSSQTPFSALTPATAGADSRRELQGHVGLDTTHYAVMGALTGTYDGARPLVLMAEDNAGTWVGYGPFPFGDRHSVGGWYRGFYPHWGALLRLDGQRLLALWTTYQVGVPQPRPLRESAPLYAQVLLYDTVDHLIIPGGPLTSVVAGLAVDTLAARAVWIPEHSMVLITGIEWYEPADFAYSINARTLKVDGVNVIEASSPVPVASMRRTTDTAENYFYAYSLVGIPPVFAVAYPDVTDLGGDIRYAKFRLGITDRDLGAIDVYDDGILIPGSATSFEMDMMGQHCRLNDDEAVAVFAHYVADYATTEVTFLLARRVI